MRQAGFTLLEVLVALSVTAILTVGSLLTIRALRDTDDRYNVLSDIHISLTDIESAIRADIGRATKTVSLEPFQENRQLIGQFVSTLPNPVTGLERQLRISESIDGIFHRRSDFFVALDDPDTRLIGHSASFFGRTYAAGQESDESEKLPLPNTRTPFQESVVEAMNQPYGPVYDYFGGVMNNGHRDSLYFRSSLPTPTGTQAVAVCYRLVEHSDRFNADRGTDGLPSEFEPGFHPIYRRDPTGDDHPSDRRIAEGDGRLDGFEGRLGGGVDSRAPRLVLQRLVHFLNTDDQLTGMTARVLHETVANDVLGFNVLVYDRAMKQYREPERLVKRFGYPNDFGAPVVATGQKSFRLVEPTVQMDTLGVGDRIFLSQRNLSWTGGDDPNTLYHIPPAIYTIARIPGPGRFEIQENIRAFATDPVHSVANMGSVGYIDPQGILRSEGVFDGFANLEPNDRVFVAQRNLLLGNEARLPDEFVYSILPKMYRVIDKSGEGIQLDLEGQQATPDVPVLFRAAYFPPAIKIELTLGKPVVPNSRRMIGRSVPIVIRMPRE